MNEGGLRELYALQIYIIMHMYNERPNSLSYLCMINHSQSYIKSPCIHTYNHTPILYTYTHFHLTRTLQRKGVHSAGFQSSQETMGYVRSPLHPLLITDVIILFKMTGMESWRQKVKFSLL